MPMLGCIGVGVGVGVDVGMSDIGAPDEVGKGVVANVLALWTCLESGEDMLPGDRVK